MAPSRPIICCLISLLWAAPALAGFELPDYVYGLNVLDGAVEQARRHNRPLAFVLTDRHTDCGLCRAASLDAFRALRSSAVLVYVERTTIDQLPVEIRVSLTSARAGRFIPKVAITGPDLREIVAVVPYAPEPRRSALLSQAVDRIRRHSKLGEPRLTLNLKPSRQAVQRVPPATPAAPRLPLPGAARPAGQAQAASATEPRSRPVVLLRWEGELAPAPADILGEFFRAQKVPMRGRCREASCRFEVTAPVATEAFQIGLQILLNRHYRVERIHTRDDRVTAWLAAAEAPEPLPAAADPDPPGPAAPDDPGGAVPADPPQP